MAKRKQRLSNHARERAGQRNIQRDAVEAAFEWGRVAPRPGGAVIYAIGRKEIKRAAKQGVDISRHNGISVVVGMGPDGSNIITTYRNKSLKALRSNRGWVRTKRAHDLED